MPLSIFIQNIRLSSIRAKLIVTFIVFFGLCTAVSLGSIWMLSSIEKKIDFLDVANNFMVEIQQARRFEKNYLLYNTNLADAREHLTMASAILSTNKDTVEKILGKNHTATMIQYMTEYSDQIAHLNKTKDIELLRQSGSQLVKLADEFVTKEREAVTRMFKLAQRAPIVFTIILALFMVAIFVTLARQLVLSLNRFMNYTKRIGEGDFTPIQYPKHHSDEFSKLADGFNHMVQELDHRQEILVQSHKLRAIGTLVAGVAHELNNPLNNSMLTASMLKEDFDILEQDDKMEMIDDLIHETERSQCIVRELLDFARETETNIKPLKIDEILRDSIRLVANQMKMAKIKMEVDIQDGLPPVHGDEQMLKQVFVNLILNAVDALPPKGTIKTSILKDQKPGFVVVNISDDGPGIPEHIKDRIFEPFFTTKSKGKGTGLGLSVSRGIVRKLGGYITLDSEEGKGTAFNVALPTTLLPSRVHGIQ